MGGGMARAGGGGTSAQFCWILNLCVWLSGATQRLLIVWQQKDAELSSSIVSLPPLLKEKG